MRVQVSLETPGFPVMLSYCCTSDWEEPHAQPCFTAPVLMKQKAMSFSSGAGPFLSCSWEIILHFSNLARGLQGLFYTAAELNVWGRDSLVLPKVPASHKQRPERCYSLKAWQPAKIMPSLSHQWLMKWQCSKAKGRTEPGTGVPPVSQRGNFTLPTVNRKRSEINIIRQNLRPCNSVCAVRKNRHTTHVVAFTAVSLLYALSQFTTHTWNHSDQERTHREEGQATSCVLVHSLGSLGHGQGHCKAAV